MTKMQRRIYMQNYYKKNKLKIGSYAKIWLKNNRLRKVEGTKIWRSNNKINVQEHNLKYRYGISLLSYNLMLIQQNKKCAICLKKVKLSVDHNHKTGKVRGLLCQRCNYMLSFFDNKILHKRIIGYLNQENNS